MTTQTAGRERRRYPRWGHRFVVRYRAIGGAHPQEEGGRDGMVLNVSRGGIVLTSPKLFPQDTLFDISIPETPLGPAREVKGKAVWSRKASESGEYQVGCMFVRIVVPQETERRRHPRKPQKLPLSLCGVEEDDSHEGLLQDLSQGGIEFLTSRNYPVGAVVQVGFPESPLGGARVVYVEVLRNNAATDRPGWRRAAGRFVRG